MRATSILQDWRRTVRERLLPGLHGHMTKALADFSLAMTRAGHCHSGQLAVHVAGKARPASAQRRLERLLANTRLRPLNAFKQLSAQALAWRKGQKVVLILDEVCNGNNLATMRLCLGYRKRAVPLFGRCYHRKRPPRPMPELIVDLLRRAARAVPAGSQVTLLMDRGLSWPAVLKTCRELGWHFVGRLQASTRLRHADGTTIALKDLAPKPGERWSRRARVFKKAGWIEGIVTAVWEHGAAEPWLLFSSRFRSFQACRGYAKRMWIEELFRDEKSQGFRWQASRVRKPSHAARLLLVLSLAVHLALCLGAWVIKSGHRRELETRRARRLSLFQLGVRWLRYCFTQGKTLPSTLFLHPI